jgi:hypothetical protein
MRSILPLHSLILLALVSMTGEARAQARGHDQPTHGRACAGQVLRSGGYRDMLLRFGTDRAALDAPRAHRFETSYRDSRQRFPSTPSSGFAGHLVSRPRYSLRPTPSCG